MENQRADLLHKLRIAFETDDITTQLIASQEQDLEELFKENIKKHNSLVSSALSSMPVASYNVQIWISYSNEFY